MRGTRVRGVERVVRAGQGACVVGLPRSDSKPAHARPAYATPKSLHDPVGHPPEWRNHGLIVPSATRGRQYPPAAGVRCSLHTSEVLTHCLTGGRVGQAFENASASGALKSSSPVSHVNQARGSPLGCARWPVGNHGQLSHKECLGLYLTTGG